MADQLTEQLVETADALVNPAGQPTRTRGTSRGVKTSIIQPVPRRSERRTTPPSLDGAAPFERESRPLPAHSSGPSRVRSVTSTITDRSEDDDASGNDDMDEAPVRLTQIVSPRTGKTRTIVRKPAAELPPTTTSVSTSVGELQFPSFMLSNQVKTFRSASHSTRRKLTATSQSAHARQQQTYSPPPEWLAAALSGNTHPHQSAPTWPATLDSFPVSRPAQLDSANGPLGSLIDDNGNSNNRHAHYDAVGSSPSFRHDTFRTMAPEPAQLLNRSPTSPLPFSLPGHMPHQHAASSPSDLTSMSRFTPPTSVTPLYEAQMLRAPPHAYAFAAEEGVFSPFSPLPSRNDQWRAQQTSGHLFLDDSFSGGDDDRHVDNDPKLSNWNDPERARLDEGQPSTSRAWHQARRSSIDYPQSDHETVPTGFARGQWPALLPQNMQNSMPLHSRETPPPNPQQVSPLNIILTRRRATEKTVTTVLRTSDGAGTRTSASSSQARRSCRGSCRTDVSASIHSEPGPSPPPSCSAPSCCCRGGEGGPLLASAFAVAAAETLFSSSKRLGGRRLIGERCRADVRASTFPNSRASSSQLLLLLCDATLP